MYMCHVNLGLLRSQLQPSQYAILQFKIYIHAVYPLQVLKHQLPNWTAQYRSQTSSVFNHTR